MSLMGGMPLEILLEIFGNLSNKDIKQCRRASRAVNAAIRPAVFKELTINTRRFSVNARPGHGTRANPTEPNPEPFLHMLRTLASPDSPGGFVNTVSFYCVDFPKDFDASAVSSLMDRALAALVNLRVLNWCPHAEGSPSINQIAFNSLISSPLLEIITISPLIVSVEAKLFSAAYAHRLTIKDTRASPQDTAALLVGCPGVTSLQISAFDHDLATLYDVFPKFVTELQLEIMDLVRSFRETTWQHLECLKLTSCRISLEFWNAKSISLVKLVVDTADAFTIEFLKANHHPLTELAVTDAVLPELTHGLFTIALPNQAAQLRKLILPSPGRKPFAPDSDLAIGLRQCVLLEDLGVWISEQRLGRDQESEDSDSPQEDSLILLADFVSRHLPALTSLTVTMLYGRGYCGNSHRIALSNALRAFAKSIRNIPVQGNIKSYERLAIHLRGKVYKPQMNVDGTYEFARHRPSEGALARLLATASAAFPNADYDFD